MIKIAITALLKTFIKSEVRSNMTVHIKAFNNLVGSLNGIYIFFYFASDNDNRKRFNEKYIASLWFSANTGSLTLSFFYLKYKLNQTDCLSGHP